MGKRRLLLHLTDFFFVARSGFGMSNIHPLRGGEGEGGEEEAAAAELRPVESVPNYVHKLCYGVEVTGSHTEAIDSFERDGGYP